MAGVSYCVDMYKMPKKEYEFSFNCIAIAYNEGGEGFAIITKHGMRISHRSVLRWMQLLNL